MSKSLNGYYIYRSSITDKKTGRKIYASEYGKKAFKIWIPNESIVENKKKSL